MPRSVRILLPIAMILLGAACAAVSVRGLMHNFRQDGSLFRGPGQTTLTLEKPGSYTLWIQNRATIQGTLMTFPKDLPSGAAIEIVHEASGNRLPLAGSTSGTMTINDTERRTIGSFTLSEPGPVRISITGLDTPRLFYLAESISFKAIFSMFALGGTGLCLLLGGVVLGIYFLVRPAPRQFHPLQPPPSPAT